MTTANENKINRKKRDEKEMMIEKMENQMLKCRDSSH